MRADRLLSILLLLQAHGRTTARGLSARLEVSERTIHRDMEALSAAGVPVLAERGAGGGWEILPEYQSRLTGLNLAELRSLLVAAPGGHLDALGLKSAAESALLKLVANLPPASRRTVEEFRQRILVDTAGWQRSTEDTSLLPLLQDAVWQDRRLRISYQRSDGTGVEREVEPLGLVVKGNVWYLVAVANGEVRTYRVSRIREAEVGPEPFQRPDGFNLAAYWQQSATEFVANLPRYPASLRAAPSILNRLRFAGRFARIAETGEPDAEGWVPVAIRFETIQEATEYVLGFGPFMEVLEPAELRQRVVEQARAVVAFYAERRPAEAVTEEPASAPKL